MCRRRFPHYSVGQSLFHGKRTRPNTSPDSKCLFGLWNHHFEKIQVTQCQAYWILLKKI